MSRSSVAEIYLWDTLVGAVSWNDARQLAFFEYDTFFLQTGIQLAPLTLPLSEEIYFFPSLNPKTFHGLPGLLADSLPDRFGNALIDVWLAQQGRMPESFTPVERLCYIGTRGMGALEYFPSTPSEKSKDIEIDALVALASKILSQRKSLNTSFADDEKAEALRDILRVGTSAGGARAKAILAWNSETQQIRSGQTKAGDGFTYWILKFDGVEKDNDHDIADTRGYGLIEYAYYLMARSAGITMQESRLLKEKHRSHFMTKRFDRTDTGDKIHMLSLGAIAHYDYNQPGAYSYEQAMRVMQRLGLPKESLEELFRRMAFNIVARNQDDHVKNIAFLMDKRGRWSLAPAFDIAYSNNPKGDWTSRHQMTLGGKRDHFTLDDFKTCAENFSLQKNRALDILAQVQHAVSQWETFAETAGVPETTAHQIAATHRTL